MRTQVNSLLVPMTAALIQILYPAPVSQAAPESRDTGYFACSAQCVVQLSESSVLENQGTLIGTSTASLVHAFRDLERQCSDLELQAASYHFSPRSLLVTQLEQQRRVQVEGGWTWSRERVALWSWFGYSRSQSESGGSRFYRDETTSYQVEFARPLDPSVCGRVDVGTPPPAAPQRYRPIFSGADRPLG